MHYRFEIKQYIVTS